MGSVRRASGVFAAVLLLLVLMPATALGLVNEGWQTQYIGAPGSPNLNAISALNENLAWAVGGFGTILYTFDGGESWTDVSYPVPGNLIGVSVVDTSTAWVATDCGMVLRTDTGGMWWDQLALPSGGGSIVGAVDAYTAWVTCGTTLFKTTDGGSTWEPIFSDFFPRSMKVIDANNAYVFGQRLWDGKRAMWRTTDGATWTETLLDGLPVFGVDTDATDPDTIWAMSDSNLSKSTDGGASWSQPYTHWLMNLSAFDAASDNRQWFIDRNNTIMATIDGSPRVQQIIEGPRLNDLCAGSDNVVWAVGDGSWIVKTTTGGYSDDVEPPVTALVSEPAPWSSSPVDVPLYRTDNGLYPPYASFMMRSYYSINDGPVQSYDENSPPQISTVGINKFEYWTVDRNDNAETTKTAYINIDYSKASTPTPSAGIITTGSIAISWPACTDDVAVDHYRLYRNGSFVATTSATSYNFTGLAPTTNYSLGVTAVDVSGKESATGTVNAATKDGTAPSMPGSLTVTNRTRNSITVRWDPSTDVGGGVREYQCYWNGNTGGHPVATNTFQFTLPSMGTTYTIDVVAVDYEFNRSASATIEAATLPNMPPVAANRILDIPETVDYNIVVWSLNLDRTAYKDPENDLLRDFQWRTSEVPTEVPFWIDPGDDKIWAYALPGEMWPAGTTHDFPYRVVDSYGASGEGTITIRIVNIVPGQTQSPTVKNVTLGFSTVTSAGVFTVDDPPAPELRHTSGVPGNTPVTGAYFPIHLSAKYNDKVSVTLPYNPALVPAEKCSRIKMYHWNSTLGIAEDITVSVDTVNHTVTGETGSFSDFWLETPPDPTPIVATDASSDLSVLVLSVIGLAMLIRRRDQTGGLA